MNTIGISLKWKGSLPSVRLTIVELNSGGVCEVMSLKFCFYRKDVFLEPPGVVDVVSFASVGF